MKQTALRISMKLTPFLLFIIAFIFGSITSHAQQPKLDWAISTQGANGANRANGVAVHNGGAYTMGTFKGTVDFDPTVGYYPLTSSLKSAFVAKYNSVGNIEWPILVGDHEDVEGYSIKIDPFGDVVIAGIAQGAADMDPGPGISNLDFHGAHDGFIAKYDAFGGYKWALSIGGSKSDIIPEIALDDKGDIYVAGYFEDTVDFDPGPANTILVSHGQSDIFVAKYSNNGNLVWVHGMGGVGRDGGDGLALDDMGHIYITGPFEDTVDFDPRLATDLRSSIGQSDIFFAKFDTAGNYIWTKQLGGTGRDNGNGITVDSDGNIFLTGNLEDTVDADPGVGVQMLTTQGYFDIFLGKYDSSGIYKWAFNCGSLGLEVGQMVIPDKMGGVYVSGIAEKLADFDPSPDTAYLGFPKNYGGFVANYDSTGAFKWGLPFDATFLGPAITTDENDNLFLSSQYSSKIDFDPGPDTFYLQASGQYDLFLAKYSFCTPDSITLSTTICAGETYILGSQVLTTSGTYNADLTSSEGCDSVVTLHLTVENLDTSVTRIDNVLTANQAGVSYQWVDCDLGYTATGATQQTFTPSANGHYAVIISTPNCSDTSTCYAITNVGIPSPADPFFVKVYPNPADKELFIHFKIDEPGEVHIRLLDAQGRMVLAEVNTAEAGSNAQMLTLDGIPSGFYHIVIQTENGTVTRRLVIQQ